MKILELTKLIEHDGNRRGMSSIFKIGTSQAELAKLVIQRDFLFAALVLVTKDQLTITEVGVFHHSNTAFASCDNLLAF